MSSERTKTVLHCAVYTRKSSEEGLEQSFNSLDAQREACEAFILSQRQEGWRAVPVRYDDGGVSGGTMERPALQRLLKDVEAGKVNVIVVYKVDRLTRSLSDFAKIVDALDAKGVCFVSVTQQFNTTTSMGRLTLNILLSFAQFEREVTGERIRDKIAASKKKGMWMGGLLPLGYNVQGRKLVSNPKEAKLVCRIFQLYLELGCVRKLALQLDRENVRSKVWTTQTGTKYGGGKIGRGALYYLLRNRLYIGELRHRQQWFAGEHQPIVPQELWNKVQACLDKNLRTRRKRLQQQSSNLLTGLIEDANGNRFTPSFTIKRGRRYRYYVSQAVIQTPGETSDGPTRLSAKQIESPVLERLLSFLNSDAEIFDQMSPIAVGAVAIQRLMNAAKKLAAKLHDLPEDHLRDLLNSFLRRVVVRENAVELIISRTNLAAVLHDTGARVASSKPGQQASATNELISLTIEATLKRCGAEVRFVVPPASNMTVSHPRPSLIKAIARAHGWYEKIVKGEAHDVRSLAREAGLTPRYVRNVLAFAFLAPDIIEAIMGGRQPPALKFEDLYKHIPLRWAEQRMQFGFPPIAPKRL